MPVRQLTDINQVETSPKAGGTLGACFFMG